MTENAESLAELAKNLNVVWNKQVELLDRLRMLEERVEELLARFRPLEDRLARMEKVPGSRAQVYSR